MPEVRTLVGLSEGAIHERIREKKFPSPIKLGRASGWIEEEIQAWIDAQIKATRGDH
ncbi:Transcriptional regulator, AlpA like [Cupriavidus basilensis]|uniref:Transcriptional regulator, AlpA like n=2 Tax=Cupriavidus basilensis TaxID=68895 RepID=A0A0C4Y1Q2_9BURK|nr:Transcriptional regulator, AlpA like [Cupriavidus basilensis]